VLLDERKINLLHVNCFHLAEDRQGRHLRGLPLSVKTVPPLVLPLSVRRPYPQPQRVAPGAAT
jgi:hypothetical protein